MRNAKAFLFAGKEDFGNTVVEAQPCGTPMIARGKSGVRGIVLGSGANGPTGVFFD
jgi:glycosyltransferase involved in cell wall biosynthesis